MAVMLVALLPGPAAGQDRTIGHAESRRFAGETLTIEGPVVQVSRAAGRSLWLSLGEAHPKSTLVIVIPEEFAQGISDPEMYEGAVVQILGRINRAGAPMPVIPGAPRGNARSTGTPRSPFVVVENMSRLRIIARADTSAAGPRRR
jgi:hypothetical protein